MGSRSSSSTSTPTPGTRSAGSFRCCPPATTPTPWTSAGFIARRVAETHPDRVVRLVLINCAVTLPTQVRREMQAAVQRLQDPLPVALVWELDTSVAHLPLPEPIFERLLAQNLKAPARVWRDGLEGLLGFDDTAEQGRIVAPTLLLWGDTTGCSRGRSRERLAAAIPGARLRVVPENGHSPHLERPEQIADDLDAFMRAV